MAESGYYAWRQTKGLSAHAKQDKFLSQRIMDIHTCSKGRYGAPRIHQKLIEERVCCSIKRVARLMKEQALCGKGKKKFKPHTTDSQHTLPIAPNLLEQKFECNEPDKIYTADITYVPTLEGWLYLAVVMDIFSRKVIGWAMDEHMPRHLVMKALRMAYWRRKPATGVVHHSDRGSQYASYDFQALLKTYGMICSMSGRGNCYDNAVTESFFHSLKVELIHEAKFKTREEAKKDIFEYIEIFYNRERIHSTLGYCSPEKFEEKYLAKVA